MRKELLLIDSHALIHRAYHALPPLTTPDGRPIGAVYGLARALIKTLKEHHPDYVVAAFDRPEETFRKSEYKEYKANREKAPDDLISQFNIARELFIKMNIAIVDYPGFEADDIIGTLSQLSNTENVHITILTGDLDSLQLVKDGQVSVQTPQKGVGEMKIYDEQAVFEKLGVFPNRVVDYKGLVGDPSDNIPGIPGVGPKTALKLLNEFLSVEDIFEKIREDNPLAKKVVPHKESAILSKHLATININVPIDKVLSDFVYHPIEKNKGIKEFFSELGFKNMLPDTEIKKEYETEKIDIIPICSIEDLEAISKDNKVSWFAVFNGKDLIKECFKKNISIPTNMLDISILFWLLHPDIPTPSYSEMTKKIIGTEILFPEKESLLTLAQKIFSLINQENLFDLYKKYEMPLIPILSLMELRGILLDERSLISLKQEVGEKVIDLQNDIFLLTKKEFNISSPKQVGEVLDELGVFEKIKRTKTGQIKTNKETLELVLDTHPVIEKILTYREYTKMLSGFIDPLLTLKDAKNTIHTTYLQTATGTGRLSSEKPNLQNIPQESIWSTKIRKSFISRKHFLFASFDYSQLELRLLAHESKDETLIGAFNEGKDIHTITASKIFHKMEGLITKQERRVGKTLNFGVIYGMGPRAFSKTSGIGIEEAKSFMDEYFSTFSSVKNWQEQIKDFAQKDGFVKNIHGRRRWFLPERFKELERAIINMPLQSHGADIMKASMIAVFDFIKKERMEENIIPILTIHDELLIEIKHDMISTIIPQIKKIMEEIESLSVPLSVETKIGSSWGSMNTYINE
jgi:DNA polymerase-1